MTLQYCPTCVKIITDDPAYAERFGPALQDLGEVTVLTIRGDAPFLTNAEIRKANSVGELNNITWVYALNLQDLQRFEV